MKLELYYVIQKYQKDGTELETPLYKAGPFPTWNSADMEIACHWLHNNCYAVVKRVVDVEEMI